MEKKEMTLNKTQGNSMELPCVRCDGRTWHEVLVSVDISGEETSWSYCYNEDYQVVMCRGCREVSFRKNECNSEDMDVNEKGQSVQPVDHQELYPSRIAGRPKLRHFEYLPFDVKSIYEGTHQALCNEQLILAGIGIRALVETVCKNKEAEGKVLEKKIDNLVDIGVLTKDGAEILHSLRILGNKAAHEVKPHSDRTLDSAMEVVEHLLKGVYILPATARKLPKRKPK